MASTNDDIVFGLLDHIYSTILKIDKDGNKKEESNLIISIQEQGRPIVSKDYRDAWTPFLENGDVGDEQDADVLPNPDNDSNIRSAYNASVLVDSVLSNSNGTPVAVTTSRISKTWEAIITGAEIDPGVGEASDEKKQMLQDAFDILYYKSKQKVLGKKDENGDQLYKEVNAKTQEHSDYLRCQKAYNKAVKDYSAAYQRTLYDAVSKKMWPVNGGPLIDEVDNTWNDWNSEGYKIPIEDAQNTIKAQGVNPTKGMIADAKNLYSVYQMALGGVTPVNLPYSYISPSNWCVDEAEIWTQYDSVARSTENHEYSTSREWSAKVKVNVGLWKVGAESSGKVSDVDNSSGESDTSISLKWAVVDIHRPWLDTSILNWSNWHIIGQFKGCINNEGNRETYLPTIPTQMIIVKDVVIKNKDIQNSLKQHAVSTDSKVSVGYGPFGEGNVGVKTDDQRKDELMDMSRQGLSFPGIQVIGWVSAVAPNSPQSDDPDRQA